MFDRDFYKNTVSNFIASSIVALLSVVAGWLFWDQLTILGSIISTPITIPAYYPFLSFISGLLVFYCGKKYWDWYSMAYTDYRKDTFDGIEWTWEYKDNGSVEIEKETLKPLCPECQSVMDLTDNEFSLRHYEHVQPEIEYPLTEIQCPVNSCGYQEPKIDYFVEGYLSEIYSKIDRKLRKEGYKP